MPLFWILFWSTFVAVIVAFLLSKLLRSKGVGISDRHQWVEVRSGRKVRGATVRESWERTHPGKSWDENQKKKSLGSFSVLLIFFLIIIIALIVQIQSSPSITSISLGTALVALVLGGASGGAYLFLQSWISSEIGDSLGLVLLNYFSMVLALGMLVVSLITTFRANQKLFSHHWLWAPLLFPLFVIVGLYLFLFFNDRMRKRKAKSKKDWASLAPNRQPPDLFTEWAFMIGMKLVAGGHDFSQTSSDNIFIAHAETLIKVLDQSFILPPIVDSALYLKAEEVLLAVLEKKTISINTQEVYEARESLVRAAEKVYQMGYKQGGFPVDPRLKLFIK